MRLVSFILFSMIALALERAVRLRGQENAFRTSKPQQCNLPPLRGLSGLPSPDLPTCSGPSIRARRRLSR